MIDHETGNINSIELDYEEYIEMKQEYEDQIRKLQEKIEDLEDENYDLKERLEEANENTHFFLKIAKAQQVFTDVLLNQLIEIKKDSSMAVNESK